MSDKIKVAGYMDLPPDFLFNRGWEIVQMEMPQPNIWHTLVQEDFEGSENICIVDIEPEKGVTFLLNPVIAEQIRGKVGLE